MIEPGMVCVSCGQPASRRSGIFNKVYRCEDCHEKEEEKKERKGWLALLGCGVGCLVVIAILVLAGCGAASALIVVSKLS